MGWNFFLNVLCCFSKTNRFKRDRLAPSVFVCEFNFPHLPFSLNGILALCVCTQEYLIPMLKNMKIVVVLMPVIKFQLMK